MKKLLTVLTLILVSLTGCTTSDAPKVQPVETTSYIIGGRYYFDADLQGQVVTDDGNVWSYTQDVISEEPSYHNEPIFAVIDDNGTPDYVEDDIILGLVLDRETAIYDRLEDELSQSFVLERNDNNIRIMTLKEEE